MDIGNCGIQMALKPEDVIYRGKPVGIRKYRFKDAQLRRKGHWEKDVYDGKWIIYSNDGDKNLLQEYKKEKLINSKKVALNEAIKPLTK